jgi:rare lipoprotein A (peptidoglycan hydrolase)
MASVAMLIIGRSRSPDREEADRQHKNSHDSLHRMRPFLSVLVVMMLIAVGPSSQSYATGGASRWRTAEIVPWYGPGFYGNRTACGQRLTRWTRGVAHRTLPCGTRIQLRKGGEWVTTRVIDRGPYPARHLYDEMPLDLTARTNCWDLNGGTYLDPCHSRTNVRWRVLR